MSKERKENVMFLVTTGLVCLRTNSQLLQNLQTEKGSGSLNISSELQTDSSLDQLLSWGPAP